MHFQQHQERSAADSPDHCGDMGVYAAIMPISRQLMHVVDWQRVKAELII